MSEARSATSHPRFEFKQVYVNLSSSPAMRRTFLFGGTFLLSETGRPVAEQYTLEQLQPYFDEGWQLERPYGFEDGAVWQSRGFFVRKDWLVGKSVALKRAITTENSQQDE